ncbi:hypothetical protein MRX96_000578 [Rhipicephalus microplus]
MSSLEPQDRPTTSVKAVEPSPPRRQFGSHMLAPDLSCIGSYHSPSLPSIDEEHTLGWKIRECFDAEVSKCTSEPLETRAEAQESSVGLEGVEWWTSGPLDKSLTSSGCFEEEQRPPKLTQWTSGPVENLSEKIRNSFEDAQRFTRLTALVSEILSTPAQPFRDGLCLEKEQQFPRLTSGPDETPSKSAGNGANLQDAQQGLFSSPKFAERIPAVCVVAALQFFGLFIVACHLVVDWIQHPHWPTGQELLVAFLCATVVVLPFVVYAALNYCDRPRPAKPSDAPAVSTGRGEKSDTVIYVPLP